MTKLLFLPDFILNANPQLSDLIIYDNFVDFDKFITLSSANKSHRKSFIENLDKESLDKEIFNEMGLGKYKKYVSYKDINKGFEKTFKDISSFYDPKIFKDLGIRKSIVLKSHFTFVNQFVHNAYLEDNFKSYLIDSDKINDNNYLGYKFLFKSRFKYDFLINLFAYSRNLIEYNRYQYNNILNRLPKLRPRRINDFLKISLGDIDRHLEKNVFFCKRELNEMKVRLEKIKQNSYDAYELALNLESEILSQINFIEQERKEVIKTRGLLDRNIFKTLWNKRPKLKKISLEASNDKLGLGFEFKD